MALSPATAPETDLDAPAHRRYVPAKRRARPSEIWRSWQVTRIVALRDVRIKYKQSLLGPVWLLLQPLGMLVGVTVAFSGITNVDTGTVPYVVFALVGVTVYAYFQLTVATAVPTMISNAPLIRRSVCPRVALVNGALVANLPTLGVMTAITLVLAIALNGIYWQIVALPFLVVAVVAFLWGPALLLASIAARFRDAIAVIPLILQAGMFVSPVGYPISGQSGVLGVVLALNPLTGLIEAWRWSILGTTPATLPLVLAAVWIVVLSVVGWRVFTRLEPEFADYL